MKDWERLIVVVPAPRDSGDPQYFENFLHRLRGALKREQLSARILVAREPEQSSGG